MPSSNLVVITQELASFLFKVGIGVQIDLASLIFDQIILLCKARRKTHILVFPQLIFKTFMAQKNILLVAEFF